MRTRVPAALLAILSACSAGAPGAEDRTRTAEADLPAVATPRIDADGAVATLAGEWRVAGIDGAALNEAYGIALSANGAEIWWEPRCAGIARRYRIEGSRLFIADVEPPSPVAAARESDPLPPPVVCAIGLPARLSDVARALDAARRVERTPENGTLLSGNGHSLLLFSQ